MVSLLENLEHLAIERGFILDLASSYPNMFYYIYIYIYIYIYLSIFVIEPNPTYFICLTMDATAYSQILHYLVSSDKLGDAKSNFRRLVKPYTVDNGVIKHEGKEVLLQSWVEDMLKAS